MIDEFPEIFRDDFTKRFLPCNVLLTKKCGNDTSKDYCEWVIDVNPFRINDNFPIKFQPKWGIWIFGLHGTKCACPYYEEFSVYIKKILQHFRLNLACGENHIINSKWAITEEQKIFLLSRPINNLRTYFKFSNESNRKKLKNLLSNKLPSKKINKTIFFNISKRTENKNFPKTNNSFNETQNNKNV